MPFLSLARGGWKHAVYIHVYNYIQVNKKFCELKGGNIGEKAQETRFGMSPKYNRYIGIASSIHVLCPM